MLGANLLKTKLIIERIMLNNKAVQKLAIEKPSTMAEVNMINKALITNVNNPRVKILIGNVKITKIGFSTTLIIPKINATKTAVQNPLRTTPGKR